MARKVNTISKPDPQAFRIGERIRALRMAKNYKTRDLARMTMLTSSMISQVERHGKSLSIDNLQRIAHSLNVPVGYFFADDQECEPQSSEKIIQPVLNSLIIGHLNNGMDITGKSSIVQDNKHSCLGSECGMILDDELVITISDKEFRFQRGDSITFKSSNLRFIKN